VTASATALLTATGRTELLAKGIGHGVFLEVNMKDDWASLVPDRIEHHWNTITAVEPNPHMVESTCQLPRIDP
jgi:hypothetical protein